MSSLANLHLQSNTKINFNGGNFSSDAGLLLLNEFIDKLGLHSLLKSCFKTTDKANRQHLDHEILLQKIYQICAGYFTDDVSDVCISVSQIAPIFDLLLKFSLIIY